MQVRITLFLLLITTGSAVAQVGGEQVFQFLNLPPSARAAALGGYHIAVVDKDPSMAIQNPALLNEAMDNHISLTVVDYLTDVIYGTASYTRSYDSHGTYQVAMRYINYGDFLETDRFGNVLGSFNAGEYNLSLAGGWQFDRIHLGTAFNVIYSQMEQYKSLGLALDLGATYHWEEKLFAASFVVKNLGYQLIAYEEYNEPMPLDVQLGVTKKFQYMPLRFGMVIHHLNIPDMTYMNPNTGATRDLETGDLIIDKIPLSEKIFRHFVFNGELVFSPNFHLRVGYNHQRRKEMVIEGKKGLIGYTFGGGIRISKFHLNYAWAGYHVAGASNHFTITSNLSSFISKKKKKIIPGDEENDE